MMPMADGKDWAFQACYSRCSVFWSAFDLELVESRHRAHLRYVLKHWEHYELGPRYGTDYLIAVLHALRQIGDATDFPFVERVAYPDKASRAVGVGLRLFRRGYNAFF